MKTTALSLITLLLFLGCGQGSSSPSTAASPAPSDDATEQLFSSDGDFAGSHILVSYQGASRASEEITRTKEEALAKAQELIEQLQDDPSQFEELARQESDGPSGAQGGSLGTWNKGQMVPEFDTAVEAMEVGAITSEPVETGFGYHVIRRNSLEVPYYGGYAFVISHTETAQTPPTVTRDLATAEALVEELKAQVNSETFEDLAKEHNDLAEEAFFLGGFKEGDNIPPELLDTLRGLSFDEVAGPISLPMGFAFVKRTRLERRSGAHILIAYQGAMRAQPTITRTKEEAQAKATELIEQIKTTPDQFATFAQENSDGPSGPQGGNLGQWFKGSMVPEFDAAIDGMEVGDITDEPVETPFGFHIIQRQATSE